MLQGVWRELGQMYEPSGFFSILSKFLQAKLKSFKKSDQKNPKYYRFGSSLGQEKLNMTKESGGGWGKIISQKFWN